MTRKKTVVIFLRSNTAAHRFLSSTGISWMRTNAEEQKSGLAQSEDDMSFIVVRIFR